MTDIVRKAGVARATYYRNFDIKEDIINTYLEKLRQEMNVFPITKELSFHNFSYENLVKRLEYIASQKQYISLLSRNGFSIFLLDESNSFAEILLGDMPNHSIERYNIYLVSGALLNLILQWVKNDCKEPPEEMARLIYQWINLCLKKNC